MPFKSRTWTILKYFRYSATMVVVFRVSNALLSSLNFLKPFKFSEIPYFLTPMMEGADISLLLLRFILNTFNVFLREIPS